MKKQSNALKDSQPSIVLPESWDDVKRKAWADLYPQGFGLQQSPIDINTSLALYDATMASTLLMEYDPFSVRSLVNTGHTFQVNFDPKSPNNFAQGGPLGASRYQLLQFHAHWSNDDCSGSEHTIDGEQFAAELHFVHYNRDKYGDFSEAVYYPDGLGVVGVMVRLGGQPHKALQKVIDNFGRIAAPHKQTSLTHCPIDVFELLPEDTQRYYSYNGSLTTPPYAESVKWIVMADALEISRDQLDAFRRLSHNESQENVVGDNIECRHVTNCRAVQPLNKRVINVSFMKNDN